MRSVLTDEDVVSHETMEVQEERLHHRTRKPGQSVWDEVDFAKACLLIHDLHKKVLPPMASKAAHLQRYGHFVWCIQQLRAARRMLAHRSSANAMSPDEAIEYLKAAQEVLTMLGLPAKRLERYLLQLRRLGRSHGLRASSLPTLPPRPKTFGREGLIAELSDLIRKRDSALIFLTGQSGIGKTTAAIEVARSLMDHFKKRVNFIPLEQVRDCDGVLERLTQISRHRGRRGVSQQRLANLLGPGPRLVLIDNFEHLTGCAAQLAELAALMPRTVFLCTSTEPPDVARARIIPMEMLRLPEADDSAGDLRANPSVQLFLRQREEAGGSSPLSEAELRLVAGICGRLDGLPLAIELAARQSAALPFGVIDRELQHFLQLPSGLDRPLRHRTVEACVRWTMSRLSSHEQLVFRRLSLIHHPVAVEAIAPVVMLVDLNLSETIAACGGLVLKGLMHLAANRIYMLDLVRAVVKSELPETESARVCEVLLATVAGRLDRLAEDHSLPLEGDLVDLPQMCFNVLLILVSRDVPSVPALQLLLSWTQLSWSREAEFGRHDIGLTAALAHYATRQGMQPNKEAAEAMIQVARFRSAYDQGGAPDAAFQAIEIALKLGDVELAERAASQFNEVNGEADDSLVRYRDAVARLVRHRISPALDAAIGTLTFGHLANIDEEWAEVRGLARQQVARKWLAVGELARAANALHEAIDWLLFGLARGAAGRRHWRTQVISARKTGNHELVAASLIAWALSELRFGEDLLEDMVLGGSLHDRLALTPTDIRRVRHIALQAASQYPSQKAAMLIGVVARLCRDPSLATESLHMVIDTMDDSPESIQRALALTSLISEHVSNAAIEAIEPTLLSAAAAWLTDNSNPMAGFSLGVHLSATLKTLWFRRARSRLDASERAAATVAVSRLSTTIELIEYTRREVDRILARERAQLFKALGWRLPASE